MLIRSPAVFELSEQRFSADNFLPGTRDVLVIEFY